MSLLHNYRQKCSPQTSPTQLILPENLKLIPLYTLTALKTPAFKLLNGTKLDYKISSIYSLLNMPISRMPYFFYPRVYKITDIDNPVSILVIISVIGLRLCTLLGRCPADE